MTVSVCGLNIKQVHWLNLCFVKYFIFRYKVGFTDLRHDLNNLILQSNMRKCLKTQTLVLQSFFNVDTIKVGTLHSFQGIESF